VPRRAARQCLACGQITGRPSPHGLCRGCQAEADARRPSRAIYDSIRWKRLRAWIIRRWVAARGWWCPGYQRGGHASRELTADHITPLARLLAAGGDPWDPANIAVLCRSCNGRKAANPATA